MTEEELTPYIGRHVQLQLDRDKLPEPQRGHPVRGLLRSIVPSPGFPPDLIAVLTNTDRVVMSVPLSLITGVTGD